MEVHMMHLWVVIIVIIIFLVFMFVTLANKNNTMTGNGTIQEGIHLRKQLQIIYGQYVFHLLLVLWYITVILITCIRTRLFVVFSIFQEKWTVREREKDRYNQSWLICNIFFVFPLFLSLLIVSLSFLVIENTNSLSGRN